MILLAVAATDNVQDTYGLFFNGKLFGFLGLEGEHSIYQVNLQVHQPILHHISKQMLILVSSVWCKLPLYRESIRNA